MKAKYIGLFAVILIFSILFIPKIHDRIVHDTVVDSNRMSKSKSQDADVVVDTSKALLSLQEVPPFTFLNQQNTTITNDFYTGKVFVVEFFFSSCTTICPIMNKNMLQLQDVFSGEENFGIASFSIDPSYDTPDVLKAYATRYGANHPNWNFLTGDKTAIHRLSNEGFKLFAAEDEDEADGFSHSGLFALIDQSGTVRSRKDKHGNPLFYYNGLEQEGIDMMIADIKKLLL
jgi:protein SCO1/2